MLRLTKRVILFKIFAALFLSLGLLLSNLPRFLPEFNQLDTFWSIPLALQVAIFIFSIFYLLIYRQLNKILFIVLLLASIGSWYSLTISNATNNIITRLGGIPIHTIEFQNIENVHFNQFTITITGTGTSKNILFMGLYPLGLDCKNIKTYLVEANYCVEYEQEQCVRIMFDSI